MVEDATKLGELLRLPNLEPETITLINAKMREFIGDVRPKTLAEQEMAKLQAKDMLDEWQNGAKEGE